MNKDINMKDAFPSKRKVRATLKSSYVVRRGEKYNPVNMKSIVRVSNISAFASREEDAESASTRKRLARASGRASDLFFENVLQFSVLIKLVLFAGRVDAHRISTSAPYPLAHG